MYFAKLAKGMTEVDKMPKLQGIREYITANVILIAAIVCVFLSGLSEIFLFVIVPACLTYIFVRFRMPFAFISALLALGVPSLIVMSTDIYTPLLIFPASLLASYSLKQHRGMLHAVVSAVIGWLASLVAVLALGGVTVVDAQGVTLLEQMKMVYEASMDMAIEAYQLSGEQTAAFYEMLTSLLPSVVVCMLTVVSYASIYICVIVLKKRGELYYFSYRPFYLIKANKICLISLAVFFLLALMTDGLIAKAAVNALIVLMFFLFVCGVSTARYFVGESKKKVLRAPLYILIILTMPVFSSMYILLGFIDALADTRSLEHH